MVTYAYLVTDKGFSPLAPPLRPKDIYNQPLGYLVDLDGDGWPDLIYLANARKQSNETVLYNPNNQTWSRSVDFQPPIAFARQGQADLGVRLVNLHGPDGRTDIIYRQDKDGKADQGAYTNNGYRFENTDSLTPGRPLLADYNLSNAVQFIDVDSDGFTDMLYSLRQKDGKAVDAVFFRNVPYPIGCLEANSSGSASSPASNACTGRAWDKGNVVTGLTPPIPFGDVTAGDLGVRFADLDGDGRPDIIYSRMEKDGTITHGWCKNNGSTWQCQGSGGYTPPSDLVFVVMPGGNNNSKSYSAQTDMQLFDVDGDGLPDLVFNYTNLKTKTARQGVCLNTGKGWPTDIKECSAIAVPVALDAIETDPKVSIQYIDINGDGLVDIVNTSSRASQTFLGTGARSGAAWQLAPQWGIPIEVIAGFRLIDANGDGLPDILYADGKTSLAYFNNGTGWTTASAGFAPPTLLSSADGSDTGVRLIDVNGDGLPDVIWSHADASGTKKTGVWLNQNRRSDVLTKVVDGLGAQTTICYQTLGELADPKTCNSPQSYADNRALKPIYAGCPPDDKPFPILCATPSSYVARKVSVAEGNQRALVYSYRYAELRFDLLSRQPLGFASRTATDESRAATPESDKHTSTTIEFYQFDSTDPSKDVWNRGLTKKTEVTTKSDKPISVVKPTWQRVVRTITPDSANPAVQFRSWTVSEAAMRTESYDLDGTPFGTEDDVFEYDDYLNVKSSVNTRSDQTSVTTSNDYDEPDTVNWILGRLKSSTVTEVGDLKDGKRQTETRKATFAYDGATGLLKQEVSNAGERQQVTADYTRDKFGNVRQTVLSALGERSRTQTRDYDSRGRFVVGETNAEGHVTKRTYSDTLGSLLSTTDPNKLVTSFAYDGFGRPIYRKDPTNVETQIVYQWLGAGPPNSCPNDGPAQSSPVYKTIAKTGSLPPVTTSFDCRGRPVDIVTFGFSGNAANQKTVLQHTDYDIYGRSIKISRPYFAGDRNPPIIERDYDALDRVIQLKQPRSGAKAITVTTYQGHKTTILDTLQHETVIDTNVRNLPITSIDPDGNTISYSYDAGDRLSGITKVFRNDQGKLLKAVTTHKYDEVGHRIATIDPDLGEWHYQYNAFGDLVLQTDAKRQVTKITYDRIDRPLTRTTTDRRDIWRYDTAPGKGIGSLRSVSSEGSSIVDAYREEYQYDNFGRQSVTTVRIKDRPSYVTNKTYDEYGRIKQTRAPGNFEIRNVYDSSGYLAKVLDTADNTTYWQAIAIDPLGRVVQEKFGNDVQTVKKYDTQSGYLTGIDTTQTPSGKHIQSSTLNYDFAGNLTTYQSLSSGRQRTTTYEYDRLQRLISVQPQGKEPQSIKYDATGGITAKPSLGYEPGTGSFNRDYKAPFHAVKSIKTSMGAVESFQYDKNGNLEQKETVDADGARSLIWLHYTVDNRVREIGAPSGGWEFEYAANGQLLLEKQRPTADYVETVTLGLTQIIREKPLLPVPRTTVWRHYLTNSEGVFAVVDMFHSDFVGAAEPTVPEPGKVVHYLHKDHLGSVERITDEKGAATTIFDYDVWGYSRTFASAVGDPKYWNRGYTGHVEIANAFFVHMNGRVYDASTASFTSPDLGTGVLTDSRTFNRYAYVLDNPLKYTDPTGYWPHIHINVGRVFSGIAHAIGSAVQDVVHAAVSAARWVEQNWREVVVIAAAICVTVVTAGTASPILVGLLVGATTSGLSTALYGGSLGDVLLASIKGGVFGAVSGGIGEALSAGSFAAILAKGGLGGVESLAQGGNVWQGFGIGALSDITPDVRSIGGFNGAAILRIGAQAALSGTIAVVEGGKFGNGAMWGAFAQLQADSSTYNWRSVFDTDTAATVGAAVNVVRDTATLVEEVKALPLMAEGIVAGAVVSTASKAIGFSGNFQYSFNFGFGRDQMSADPFTMGVVLLGASNTPKWSDAREYGVQGVGTAVFGGYSFQLAPTGNISGTLGIHIQGPALQQNP
jgi:RHS repeat-associated protein